ncbi:MAG: hypothetical protein N3A60_04470 [Thermanaerothrix sp.]|nr:hypothetical protein [Thermanaerothrix sp.]
MVCATFILDIGRVKDATSHKEQTLEWFETWQIPRLLSETALDMGFTPVQAQTLVTAVRVLIAHQDWYEHLHTPSLVELMGNWLSDPAIQDLIGLHTHAGTSWVHKEGFETLIALMQAIALLSNADLPTWKCTTFYERVLSIYELGQNLCEAATQAGYNLEAMMRNLQQK